MTFAEIITSIHDLELADSVELSVTVGQLRAIDDSIRGLETRFRALYRIVAANSDNASQALEHAEILKRLAGL